MTGIKIQKSHTPSEHPNPTTKIKPQLGGEFTYQPKWDPIGVDPQPVLEALKKEQHRPTDPQLSDPRIPKTRVDNHSHRSQRPLHVASHQRQTRKIRII